MKGQEVMIEIAEPPTYFISYWWTALDGRNGFGNMISQPPARIPAAPQPAMDHVSALERRITDALPLRGCRVIILNIVRLDTL